MCGLCGTLGGPAHWTDAAGRLDGSATRRAERLQQVRVCNALLKPLRLRLDDWQGSAFLLNSATGRTALAATLPEVWAAAQAMSPRAAEALDPLDPELLAALAAIAAA